MPVDVGHHSEPKVGSSGITPEHIAGLVVGEGCFYAESCADPKYRSGWRIRPAFCIEMREDDRDALEAVRAHLGCGSIYRLDFGRYRDYTSKGWRPHVKYRVGSLLDLRERVVPFFRSHILFGRKREAFELFAVLVDKLSDRDHLTTVGLEESKAIAYQLAQHNKRGK